MELKHLQQALRSIPQLEDPGAEPPAGVADALGAATEFSKLLRKLGSQQGRDAREILSALQKQDSQSGQIQQAWQREQERASASEQQLARMADVLVAAFDVLDRMLAALVAAGDMDTWEKQARQGIELCLHNAEKVGLVPLGAVGEPFDVSIHNLVRAVPPRHRGPVQVGAVVARGYALNGRVLRRAEVDFE